MPCLPWPFLWGPHSSAVWSTLLAVQGHLPLSSGVQTCLVPRELL